MTHVGDDKRDVEKIAAEISSRTRKPVTLEGTVIGPTEYTSDKIIIPIDVEMAITGRQPSKRKDRDVFGYKPKLVYNGPALPIVKGSRVRAFFDDQEELRSATGGFQQEVTPSKIELLASDGSVVAIVHTLYH